MINKSYKFFLQYNDYLQIEVIKMIRPISLASLLHMCVCAYACVHVCVYVCIRIIPGRTITMNGSCRTEYSGF